FSFWQYRRLSSKISTYVGRVKTSTHWTVAKVTKYKPSGFWMRRAKGISLLVRLSSKFTRFVAFGLRGRYKRLAIFSTQSSAGRQRTPPPHLPYPKKSKFSVILSPSPTDRSRYNAIRRFASSKSLVLRLMFRK